MVRHNDGVRPELDGCSGIFDIEDAFDNDFARPDVLYPLDVLPVQRRIELTVGPLREGCDVFHALQAAGEIAKCFAFAFQNAERPARLPRNLDDVAQTHFRRHRHAIADVAMALAKHLQVDGENQRIAFGDTGARENIAREAAIANDVKLKPEWPRGRLRHLLDRANGHSGQGEWDARLFGRLRRQYFTVTMLHPAQSDRREREWSVDPLSDDRRGEASLRHVDHHALAQLDRLKVGAVRAQRLLVIGAAVDIIEKSFRNFTAGSFAQVFDTGDGLHGNRFGYCSAIR